MSHQQSHRIGRSGRFCFGALLFVLVLGGCGGGVDSGGTGAPATSAIGPITGFGSVIVNGVHFDDSSADVTDADGTAHSRDDLKLGMTTIIRGSTIVVDANGARSTATSIIFASALLGPVNNIDTGANTLVVLGQTVDVKPTTVFDDSLNGGLAALFVGDVVEIYALFDASSDHYSATRIERKTNVPAYHLRGVVSNLDTATQEFNIGSERISYAGVPAGDVPAALANGHFIRVQVRTAQVGGVWVADKLQDGVGELGDQDEARVEGLISDFTSSTQFSVDGVSVDASHASVSGGTALGLGVRVAVKGTASNGVLIASEVQTKSEDEVENEGYELNGTISTIDTFNETFVLLGITIDYSGNVEFRDGTIFDLAVGKQVEVRGTLSADHTGLRAFRIRFEL